MSDVGYATDQPLPELGSITPVHVRPGVDADLRAMLIGMEEGLESLDSLDAAMTTLEQMWELLPEPREAWDYFSEVIPRRAAELSIRLSRLDEAEAWLERYDLGSAPRDGLGQHLFDFVKAKLAYRRGDHSHALPAFKEQYRLFGRSGFLHDPSELRFLNQRLPSEDDHGVRCTDPVCGWELMLDVERASRKVYGDLLTGSERLMESVWGVVSLAYGLPSHDRVRLAVLVDLTELMVEQKHFELASQLIADVLAEECQLDAATQLRVGDLLMACGDFAGAMDWFRSAYSDAPWLERDRREVVQLMHLF